MSLQLTVRNKLPVVRRPSSIGEVLGAFESDTVAVFVDTAPRHQSIVMYVLCTMLVLALLLACIVKIDRVVTSQSGIVMTSSGSLYVDPLNPAQVRSVNVKPGQVVKKGQALATLDPTFTQADLSQMQDHMASDQSTVNREESELANRPYVFSTTDKYQAIQGGIYLKRQAQYHADLANFDGQINAAQAQMSQALSDQDKYTTRLKLNTQMQHIYEPLLEKGYVSQLQVLTSTDTTTEISRLLADARNQISQYREMASALRAQRDSYVHKWYSDTASQLVLDRNDLELTRDSLEKDTKLQELTSLDSPADAIVLKVGKLSPGSIAPGQGQGAITPGADPLITLAPLDAPVEAEIDIATTDVGFIAVRNPVQLKLDSYDYVLYGMAYGVVKSISEGSFSVDQNNNPVAPYFKVKVKITGLAFHDVPPDFRLVPGMTLVGNIMVGRRTIMSYLTETLMRQGSEAMREPQ
jgi:hemolysin D